MGSGSSKSQKVGIWSRKRKSGSKPGMSSRSSSFPTAKKDGGKSVQSMPRILTDGVITLEKGLDDDESTSDPMTTVKPAPEGELTVAPLYRNGDMNDNGIVFSTPPRDARKVLAPTLQYQNILKPSELYNLITAETWQGYPQIHDTSYMLLLDCRERKQYEQTHIVTARHHSALYSEYGLLLPRQLQSFGIIVLYSHSPSCQNLKESSKKLTEDNVEHFVLLCGASKFLSTYSFLGSSQTNSFTAEMRKTFQTMPSEVIPGRLYQGNAKHALDPYIIKSLGITHIVNVTLEHPNRFEDTVEYLRIQLDDKPHVNLHSWLPKTSEFMSAAIGACNTNFSTSDDLGFIDDSPDTDDNGSAGQQQHGVVLVHCNLGRSRSSTVTLAYLMKAHKLNLDTASNFLKDCRPTVRPNVGFLDQLLTYEKEIFGKSVTRLNDLPF